MTPAQITALAIECGFLEIPCSADFVANKLHLESFAARVAETAIAEHLVKQSTVRLPALPPMDAQVDLGEWVLAPNGYTAKQMREYAKEAIAALGVTK